MPREPKTKWSPIEELPTEVWEASKLVNWDPGTYCVRVIGVVLKEAQPNITFYLLWKVQYRNQVYATKIEGPY